jgi:hypothetical protein
MEVVKQGSACVGLHSTTHAIHAAITSHPLQADHGEFTSVPCVISSARSVHATPITPYQYFVRQEDVEVDPEVDTRAHQEEDVLQV